MARTDWTLNDTVQPADMNQIGQEINDNQNAVQQAQQSADNAQQTADNAQQTANSHASRHAIGGADELTPEQIGAASLTQQNAFTQQQILQGTKFINYSVNSPYQGLTELGRFTMTEAHDQVWIKGTLQSQTGSASRSIYFDILFRTGASASLENVNIYRERNSSSSDSVDVAVYHRDVSGGSEFVVCAVTGGNQFAAYEMTMASRRPGGYDFNQSDMRSAFSTSGFSNVSNYGSTKKFMHTVDMGSNQITGLANPTSSHHAVNQGFADGRYALKGSANTFTAAQTIQDRLRFTATAESGIIQAGLNASDPNARLRVARNGTTSTAISLFEIFANAVTINGQNVATEGRENIFDPKQQFNNGIRIQNGGASPALDIHFANGQYELYPVGSGFQQPIMIGREQNRVDMPGGATIQGNTAWHGGNNPSTKSVNGYQRLASGVIIQWMQINSYSSGSTITFPIAFPNSPRAVLANARVSGANTTPVSTSVTIPDRFSCQIHHDYSGSVDMLLYAIGY